MTDPLIELKAFFDAKIALTRGQPICDQLEVARLEEQLGHRLPAACHSYFFWMGNDTAGVLRVTDCFVHDVIENNQALPELLAENQITFSLPDHYCCFDMHQGYAAAWFDPTSDSDDPPCWFFCEGQTATPVSQGRVSQFISAEVRGVATLSLE